MLCDTDERGPSHCPSRGYSRSVSKAICDCRGSTIDISAFSVTDASVVVEARLMNAGCSRLLISECDLSEKAIKDII